MFARGTAHPLGRAALHTLLGEEAGGAGGDGDGARVQGSAARPGGRLGHRSRGVRGRRGVGVGPERGGRGGAVGKGLVGGKGVGLLFCVGGGVEGGLLCSGGGGGTRGIGWGVPRVWPMHGRVGGVPRDGRAWHAGRQDRPVNSRQIRCRWTKTPRRWSRRWRRRPWCWRRRSCWPSPRPRRSPPWW